MNRGLLLVALLLLPSLARAQGISARVGPDDAVIGQDVVVRIEVTDPVQAIRRVEVDLRASGAPSGLVRSAEPIGARAGASQWWQATFTSTTVWTATPPAELEVRARLLGARGGVVLTLGDIQPFVIDVVSPVEARRRAKTFARARRTAGADVPFAGYVGALGHAGTGARARLYLGFGGPLSSTVELVVGASVGPAFARPDAVAGGGPITLGAELAARLYTRPLTEGPWSLFAAPYGTVDFRFPGVDAGGGLQAGAVWVVRSELAVEAAVTGAVVARSLASAPQDDGDRLGFVGGIRVGIRLGAVGGGASR